MKDKRKNIELHFKVDNYVNQNMTQTKPND